jgi:hypothetical protein
MSLCIPSSSRSPDHDPHRTIYYLGYPLGRFAGLKHRQLARQVGVIITTGRIRRTLAVEINLFSVIVSCATNLKHRLTQGSIRSRRVGVRSGSQQTSLLHTGPQSRKSKIESTQIPFFVLDGRVREFQTRSTCRQLHPKPETVSNSN